MFQSDPDLYVQACFQAYGKAGKGVAMAINCVEEQEERPKPSLMTLEKGESEQKSTGGRGTRQVSCEYRSVQRKPKMESQLEEQAQSYRRLCVVLGDRKHFKCVYNHRKGKEFQSKVVIGRGQCGGGGKEQSLVIFLAMGQQRPSGLAEGLLRTSEKWVGYRRKEECHCRAV